MPRFIIDPSKIMGDRITIEGSEAHHMVHVLRLQPGDTMTLADGIGSVYPSRIEAVRDGRIDCLLLRREAAGAEPPLDIVLVQGLTKGERMDLVIQKGVELGVRAFLPVQCRRSVVRLDAKKRIARQERWQRIAQGAAKQCGRGIVPEVMTPVDWGAALEQIPPGALIFIPWEEETNCSLKGQLHSRIKPDTVYVIIGPEGGLEKQEVDQAVLRGAVAVTLGPRILRSETAGLAAAAMLLYHWGDLGGAADGDKKDSPGDIGL